MMGPYTNLAQRQSLAQRCAHTHAHTHTHTHTLTLHTADLQLSIEMLESNTIILGKVFY